MHYEKPMAGTLRLSNAKTIHKWISSGKMKAQANAGWIFSEKCGRFRPWPCHCSRCMKQSNRYYGKQGWFQVSKEALEELKAYNNETT